MRAREEAKRLVTRTASPLLPAGLLSAPGMPGLLCCLLQINADQKWLVEAASSAGQTWIHTEYCMPSRLTAEYNSASVSDPDAGSQFSVHMSPAALPPAEMRPPPGTAAPAAGCIFVLPRSFLTYRLSSQYCQGIQKIKQVFMACLDCAFSFRQLLSRFPRR
jgi:hypothetical protein